ADTIPLARAHQAHALEIILKAQARDAPRRREQPPRHAARIGAEVPARAARDVEESVTRLVFPGEGAARADRVEIRHRRSVAGDQEMIAVIDPRAERGVEIGT